jgi:hypothetical protein
MDKSSTVSESSSAFVPQSSELLQGIAAINRELQSSSQQLQAAIVEEEEARLVSRLWLVKCC